MIKYFFIIFSSVLLFASCSKEKINKKNSDSEKMNINLIDSVFFEIADNKFKEKGVEFKKEEYRFYIEEGRLFITPKLDPDELGGGLTLIISMDDHSSVFTFTE